MKTYNSVVAFLFIFGILGIKNYDLSAINAPDLCAPLGSYISVVGDSFCNGSNEFQSHINGYQITSSCSSGQTLSTIASNFDSSAFIAKEAGSKYIIVEGGINDICGGNKSAEFLMSLVIQMTKTANDIGIGLLILDAPPIKNNSCWNEAKQSVIDEYTNSLTIHANSYTFVKLVNMNQVLDTNNDNELDELFDNGDGLHPNSEGSIVIGIEISKVLQSTCN